ncbi:hypothetical protein H8356DRAFT_1267826 [Neocallimastix lanati (nom. inval.)]|uniref:Uncharacterized protein n=1 Tax=Neocallimastix californiae TaxID=1754190 RepID=A0A1Y2D804_9FUNG|nr:hypothetical protein H8356DRAFT_1267826 [Neocallimastix sp. JGI-2020a]ORY55391.1 hypothetical protein LY90DRAFT_266026 [Neocallimastix californiae]|eukprot:ORY55391.1 hypothetical protein LY90DRAFT_266026 [Neocallimastix californiae]
MVQGALKKKSSKSKSIKKVVPKRGVRIAPKKNTLIKQRKLQKKLTSKSTQNIEKNMAAKAAAVGKLTIMKPKKDEKEEKTSGKKS